MVRLAIVILFIWFPWYLSVFKELLSLVELWQKKKYRLDKVFAMFYDVDWKSDKRLILLVVEFVLFLIGLLYFWFPQLNILLASIIIAFMIFVYRSIDIVKSFFDKTLPRPDFSIRNIVVVIISTIILCLPLALTLGFGFKVMSELGIREVSLESDQKVSLDTFYSTQKSDSTYAYPFETILILISALFWLSFDVLISIIVSVSVILTIPIAGLKRRIIINSAKRKVKTFTNLKVIGITGSFGKTTTKNILYEILKNKFKTVKTPRNYNSDLGIALTINNDINEDTEIFIAEMAAYTRGEIKDCCQIVQPDIAIITGVNEEHLALFKSLENTLLTKYEIVEYSKEDCSIILNADNEYTLKMEEMTKKKKIMFSISKEVDIFAEEIEVSSDRLKFDVIAGDQKEHFEIQILGQHNVMNILAAIAAAMQLGMKLSEISMILKDAGNLGYLNFRKGINESRIIDDSYNSNPAGFEAAIMFMKQTSSNARKILITSGILELGKDKEMVYEKMKKAVLSGVNIVITSDSKLYKLLKDEKIEVHYTPTFKEELTCVKNILKKNDVALFEGANMSLYNEIVLQS